MQSLTRCYPCFLDNHADCARRIDRKSLCECGCEAPVHGDGIEFNVTNAGCHECTSQEKHGKITSKTVLRHDCDNPLCINLEHLVPGSQADNVRDRVERGRSAIGIKNGRAKLSESDVEFIRSSDQSCYALEKVFGVNRKAIANARNRKTWKHV